LRGSERCRCGAALRILTQDLTIDGLVICEAFDSANEYASRTDAFLLNDATNPNVPAATATIGVEVIEQLPEVAAIWVPMGDTALIRGIAFATKHLRPAIRIVGIQAERRSAPSIRACGINAAGCIRCGTF